MNRNTCLSFAFQIKLLEIVFIFVFRITHGNILQVKTHFSHFSLSLKKNPQTFPIEWPSSFHRYNYTLKYSKTTDSAVRVRVYKKVKVKIGPYSQVTCWRTELIPYSAVYTHPPTPKKQLLPSEYVENAFAVDLHPGLRWRS